MFRAKTIAGIEVTGWLMKKENGGFFILGESIDYGFQRIEVRPNTVEIFMFGDWRLVSELETKYKLVEV